VSSGSATVTIYCSASSITLTEITSDQSDYTTVSSYAYTENPSAASIISSNLWHSIIPRIDNTYTLGSTNYKWANIYATTFTGNLTGNADTATQLATAVNLKVDLSSTTAVTFDGSASQEAIPVSGTLGIVHGGTGSTTVDPHAVLIGPTNGTAAAAPTWRTMSY
jgi:hypothetical protein